MTPDQELLRRAIHEAGGIHTLGEAFIRGANAFIKAIATARAQGRTEEREACVRILDERAQSARNPPLIQNAYAMAASALRRRTGEIDHGH